MPHHIKIPKYAWRILLENSGLPNVIYYYVHFCAGKYFYAGIIQVAENSGDPGLDFGGMGLCEQLVALNVGTITFIGDAFIRQLFISDTNLSGDQLTQTGRPASVNQRFCKQVLR